MRIADVAPSGAMCFFAEEAGGKVEQGNARHSCAAPALICSGLLWGIGLLTSTCSPLLYFSYVSLSPTPRAQLREIHGAAGKLSTSCTSSIPPSPSSAPSSLSQVPSRSRLGPAGPPAEGIPARSSAHARPGPAEVTAGRGHRRGECRRGRRCTIPHGLQGSGKRRRRPALVCWKIQSDRIVEPRHHSNPSPDPKFFCNPIQLPRVREHPPSLILCPPLPTLILISPARSLSVSPPIRISHPLTPPRPPRENAGIRPLRAAPLAEETLGSVASTPRR